MGWRHPLVASQNGQLEAVLFLLSDAGADKDIPMQGGGTPLFIASLQGHQEVVCLLSGAGADKDIAMREVPPRCPSHLRSGRLEVVRLLSYAGADKDIAMQSGGTPLLIAPQGGHLESLSRIPTLPPTG